MSIPRDHRDLFRIPNTSDKLDLLASLAATQELIPDLALALINIIRGELERPQTQTAAAYRYYAHVMGSLQKQRAEIYRGMAAAWQQHRQNGSAAKQLPQGPFLQAQNRRSTEAESEHVDVELDEEEEPLVD